MQAPGQFFHQLLIFQRISFGISFVFLNINYIKINFVSPLRISVSEEEKPILSYLPKLLSSRAFTITDSSGIDQRHTTPKPDQNMSLHKISRSLPPFIFGVQGVGLILSGVVALISPATAAGPDSLLQGTPLDVVRCLR